MLQSPGRELAIPSTTPRDAAASAAGLILLGLTTLLFGFHHAGLFPFDAAVLATGVFYGALGQIAAGLSAWRRRDACGTVLGTAFGLFWFSQLALTLLPETGFGRTPQPAAVSSYFAMWGLFTAILMSGSARFGRELRVFLTAFGLFLLLLAAGAAFGSPLLNAMAGGEGIACGLAGVYAGIVRWRNEGVEGTTRRP